MIGATGSRKACTGRGNRGDVLHAVKRIADRTWHDISGCGCRPDQVSRIGAECRKLLPACALKQQIAAGGQRAGAATALALCPGNLAHDRVPGQQVRTGVFQNRPSQRGVRLLGQADVHELIAQNLAALFCNIRSHTITGRHVHQPGVGVIGLRRPSVGTGWYNVEPLAGLAVVGLRIKDRLPVVLRIKTRRPVDAGHERIRRHDLAGGHFNDIENAVLGRLHHHVLLFTRHQDVGNRERRCTVVIKAFHWRGLVVPLVLAGFRIQRHDGGDKQVVAAIRRTQIRRPGNAVPGPEDHRFGLRVVENAVPNRAAAAGFPPVTGPGIGRHGHHAIGCRVIGTLGRIARHGPKAPQRLAGFRIVRREEATRIELSATLTDVHNAIADARCAGDGIGHGTIGHLHVPRLLSGFGVDRNQAAIQRAPDDLAVPIGHAPVGDVAAQGDTRDLTRHVRVELPQQLSGSGVERVDLAPRCGHVQTTVDDKRRALVAAALGQGRGPRQAQLVHVTRVDLRQRAEALLAGIAPMAAPLSTGIRARVAARCQTCRPTKCERRANHSH